MLALRATGGQLEQGAVSQGGRAKSPVSEWVLFLFNGLEAGVTAQLEVKVAQHRTSPVLQTQKILETALTEAYSYKTIIHAAWKQQDLTAPQGPRWRTTAALVFV